MSWWPRVPRVAVLAVAALLLTALDSQRAETCRMEGVPEPLRCVWVEVPEVHGSTGGRTLRIRVVVLPSLGAPQYEPLLLLQGGPGVAGTLMARNFHQRERLRAGRDLVFFDQRGAGASGVLTCAGLNRSNFLGALFPPDHVRACYRDNARRATLSAYTNAASATDLEAVRKALGAEVWSLLGFSFGTRLAQEYAREYPGRVRAVVLDGVVPFDAQLTADLAPTMERSLDYVVTRCERDADCRSRYPDTQRSLVRLGRMLDSAAVRVSVADSAGRRLEGSFGRWDFAYAIRGMLYGPQAASIPAWIHHASRTRDFTSFARVYWQRSRWMGDSTGVGLHLGVYCAEDLPFTDSTEAVRRARGTLIGPRYYQEYRSACANWPVPGAPADMRRPWTSDIPTLLISGERDPVTPPEYGDRVASHLSRSRHIVVPGGGHAEQSTCRTDVIATFLANPLSRSTGRTCLHALEFPAFEVLR